jgi:hypothetical protein
MFRCKYVKDIIPENGTLTIGPYSNGQMATFSTDTACPAMWAIGLGVVLKRHYCGRGAIDFSHIPQEPAPTIPFPTTKGKISPAPPAKQTFSNGGKSGGKGGKNSDGYKPTSVPVTDYTTMLKQLQQGITQATPNTKTLVKQVVDALVPTFETAVKQQLTKCNSSKTPPQWLNPQLQTVIANPLTTHLDGLTNTINSIDARIPAVTASGESTPVQNAVTQSSAKTNNVTNLPDSAPGLQNTRSMPSDINSNTNTNNNFNSNSNINTHVFAHGHLNMSTHYQQDLQATFDRHQRNRALERRLREEEERERERERDLRETMLRQQIATLNQQLGRYDSTRPRM